MKFSVDRVEGDLAICYDENEKRYEFKRDKVGLAPGSLFTAVLDGKGEPGDIVFLAEETAAARARMKHRLDSLFNRHQ